jgi:hypothetical protein
MYLCICSIIKCLSLMHGANIKKKYHIKYGNTYAVRESQPLEPAKKIRKIKRHIPHCTVYSAYRISLVWLSELETANSFR